ncbi:MAG: CotH kinase family protein [Planctomycetes bacterium]|nr:CotH kinase family protein [Planctomycetota bacterium]
MRTLPTPVILVFLFILGLCPLLRAEDRFEISEFMAVNVQGLDDEDRDEEDWIEIHNAGASAASLEGWCLTDNPKDLTKWKFPAVTLEADAYLVVFASGKNRKDPARELHTNFKLSASGEYLGLVRPDKVTVASAFSPAYPIQAPDVSYGLSGAATEEVLLALGAPAKALVPLDNALEPPAEIDTLRPWALENCDDSAWLAGTTGVGFGYAGQIGLDVSTMRNVNETVYVRVPFVVEDPALIRGLTLRIAVNDGMIAYINGHEVARDNAPAPAVETWNSGAPANGSVGRTVAAKDFSIRRFDFLHVGTNVLAIQGLNNGLASPNLLIAPELLATVAEKTPKLRYFPTPTPGQPNGVGVEVLGPIISETDYSPALPGERDGLQITARITPSFDRVASVQLRYRLMFDAEMTIPLLDDGKSGDGAAGDEIYGARIPTRTFKAGQMVRWAITATDTAGRTSRFPAFLDPLNSPEYCGTVVADPSLTNPLPVLHWFIQNPNAANTDAGTRCSLFFDGEFYDNVGIYIHGQSSRSFPKKSYNIDLNRGDHFRWAPGQPRVANLNLMTTYPDKAHMRNILCYETYRDADCPYHWVFPVRVQQNGEFWGTAHVMENGDQDWLIRLGLNREGALYKMYNTFGSVANATGGIEKKTRKNEDSSDLVDLFNGISLSGEPLRVYLYDNVDVAQVVNFLAARIITGDVDCCHKNYYFYRDTNRSNEWQMWPWDVDLSFGRVWTSSMTYWDQTLNPNTSLFVGNNNRLPQAIFGTPEMRQMYLRRIRTLMDELLKSAPAYVPPPPAAVPGPTPRPRGGAAAPIAAAADPNIPLDMHYEPRIDELAAQIGPDAALDAAKWNSHAWGNGSTAPNYPQPYADAVKELRDSYLPQRRRQLFNRLAGSAGELPEAQPAGTTVSIAAVEINPRGGNADEGYIKLQNPNSFAVDISRWTLIADGNAKAPLFTFRGGTVIPTGGTLYVAANRVAFRARRAAPTGGQALFIVGDYGYRLPVLGQTLELIDRQGVKVASIAK